MLCVDMSTNNWKLACSSRSVVSGFPVGLDRAKTPWLLDDPTDTSGYRRILYQTGSLRQMEFENFGFQKIYNPKVRPAKMSDLPQCNSMPH